MRELRNKEAVEAETHLDDSQWYLTTNKCLFVQMTPLKYNLIHGRLERPQVDTIYSALTKKKIRVT